MPAYPPEPSRLERTLPRLRSLVEDAGCKVALTTAFLLEMAQAIFELAPELKALSWLSVNEASDPIDPSQIVAIAPDQTCFIQYTSGSTGTPKGVVLTHQNLMTNERQIQQAMQMSSTSHVVSWLPTYHDMGLIGMLFQPMFVGSSCTFMSPLTFLQKPIRWLRAISKYQAYSSGAPNFGYDLCVRRVKPAELAGLDLSCWEVAYCGAERVRTGTLRRFLEKFAAVGFKASSFTPVYGLAEGSLLVSGRRGPIQIENIDKHSLENEQRAVVTAPSADCLEFVGCGAEVDGETIRVVEPQHRTVLPDGQIGEVWVQGPNVAKGYWNKPELSERALRAQLSDGSGAFMRTGDLGYLRGGELFIVGRLKDIVIIRGRNYFPDDLENAVESAHRALRPGCSAVFAVDRADAEHLVVVAELERRRLISDEPPDPRRIDPTPHLNDPGDPPIDPEEVAMAIQQKISETFQLRADHIWLLRAGTISKTSSGKIQRHLCRRDFESAQMVTVYQLKVGR